MIEGTLTSQIPFDEIPAIDNHLFEVRAGVPSEYAMREAVALANSIASICTTHIGEATVIEVSEAHLIRHAVQMIESLILSVEDASSLADGA